VWLVLLLLCVLWLLLCSVPICAGAINSRDIYI
jgi:hypothetical protein